MSVRLRLTDEIWSQLQPVVSSVKRKDGRPPSLSDRLFIEAVLYIARTGVPWRDLPNEPLGNWSAVYNRLRRWKRNGTWQNLWQQLQTEEMALAENLYIDSTCVRAHQHAAGSKKKRRTRKPSPWEKPRRVLNENPPRLHNGE